MRSVYVQPTIVSQQIVSIVSRIASETFVRDVFPAIGFYREVE
jgi:hypothetical protein